MRRPSFLFFQDSSVSLFFMQKDETDLRKRTKDFALHIVRVFSTLAKTTEAQVASSFLVLPFLVH
ncbi:MAG: hypothetical protein DME45_10445 [Verrucomicrobia bacterium]|nr:MAG: hypothetical protein DME45_10445 [Verrucomicrobiota bacterium]